MRITGNANLIIEMELGIGVVELMISDHLVSNDLREMIKF